MATDEQSLQLVEVFAPYLDIQDDDDFIKHLADKALKVYEASKTDAQLTSELEARGHIVGKRVEFNPHDESTWPKFFGDISKECEISEAVLDQCFNKVKLIKFDYTPNLYEKETEPCLTKYFVDCVNGNEVEYVVTHWQAIPQEALDNE